MLHANTAQNDFVRCDRKRRTWAWTVDEYHNLIDAGLLDGRRIGLVYGHLIEMGPKSPEHADSEKILYDALSGALKNCAIVRSS